MNDMKKISTLFKKDPNDLGRVIDEVDPENAWALTEGIATRKFDGTACAIIDGELYKRYDVKRNKKTGEFPTIPDGAIPCQEPDAITGHWPHWVKCDRSKPEDKYHFEAFDVSGVWANGTYELCGPKINGNNEKLFGHFLLRHGGAFYGFGYFERSFEGIRFFLKNTDIEGIIFRRPDGRMCKIRKSDFGIIR